MNPWKRRKVAYCRCSSAHVRIFNEFRFDHLRGDLLGGLSAAVVALPLGLAFGVASGLGPEAGIYSAALVGFFAAVFGGTPVQISGPTGPMTVVISGILIEYLANDPTNGHLGAFAIIVMAGCFQVMFGILRFGRYVVQVSYPVISGFMSGIGVIIILIQLHPLLGLDAVAGPVEAIRDLPALASSFDMPTSVLGIGCLVLAFIWPGRFNDFLPVPLLLIVAGSLAVWLAPGTDSIATIGAIKSGLPTFQLPPFEPALLVDEIASALIIAALGSIDSLLTSLVADNMTGTQHESDQELIGQGIGNVVAGLFGALPGAGATVRTVVNIKNGGNSAVSGVFHALIVFALMIGAGGLTAYVPHAVLAAILIKVGVDILDRKFIRRLPRIPFVSAGLMLLVLGLTVFVDLITAVFVGIFIANMITVDRLTNVQLDNIQLGVDANTGEATLQLNGPISFAVGRGLNRRLRELGDYGSLKLDLSNAQLLGVTTALVVLDIVEAAQAKGKRVMINQDLDRTVFGNLHRLGVFERIPLADRY